MVHTHYSYSWVALLIVVFLAFFNFFPWQIASYLMVLHSYSSGRRILHQATTEDIYFYIFSWVCQVIYPKSVLSSILKTYFECLENNKGWLRLPMLFGKYLGLLDQQMERRFPLLGAGVLLVYGSWTVHHCAPTGITLCIHTKVYLKNDSLWLFKHL